MKSGIPLEWCKPLQKFSTNLGDDDPRLHPDILGCHRGDFFGLNVVNPQPNYIYYHCRNKLSIINNFRRRGWRLVKPGDPETLAAMPDGGGYYGEDFKGSEGGGISAAPDIVLMRIHESDARRIAKEKMQANEIALDNADSEFRSRGESLLRSMGGAAAQEAASRGDLYFSERGHGFSKSGGSD